MTREEAKQGLEGYSIRYIVRRRCDEPMRRSKEQGKLPDGRPWRCTGECKECFCCIYTTDDGRDHHTSLLNKLPEEYSE